MAGPRTLAAESHCQNSIDDSLTWESRYDGCKRARLSVNAENFHVGTLTYTAIQDPLVLSSGLSGIALSWISNIWATMLISWKAWSVRPAGSFGSTLMVPIRCRQHRRMIKRDLVEGGQRTRAEKVLVLLIESGVVYSLLLVGTFSFYCRICLLTHPVRPFLWSQSASHSISYISHRMARRSTSIRHLHTAVSPCSLSISRLSVSFSLS